MQSTIKWMRQKDDDRNPIVEVKHNEYCGECRKHLIFRLGGEVVEVYTDENGLKRIADAIADHPKQMQRKAEAKAKEAIAEARRLGVELVEAAPSA